MTTNIAIFGASGFGRETALLIRQINQVQHNWNLIGFFDDGIQKGNEVDGIKVLGSMTDLNQIGEKLSLVVAVADPRIRKDIVSKIQNENIDFPVMKHPHNFLGDEATNQFGKGSIITAGNIFTTNIHLEEFVIVNLACTIGHDSRIRSFTTIMPGCSISGNVSVGSTSLIGAGVRILQGVSIGNTCKVGAGAVVIKDSRNEVTLVGVPAKEV